MEEKFPTDIPVIKKFLVSNNYFLYDTYTNQLLKISKDIFKEVCKLERVGVSAYKAQNNASEKKTDVLLLIEKGLFRNNFIEEVIHPETENIYYLLNRCIN